MIRTVPTAATLLADIASAPDWTGALCAQADPDLWYPEHPNQHIGEAARICRRCPLRATCLAYALDNDERHGVWGGLTPRERERIRALRRAS